jgi:EmrB/QacA subfamily drug resistance transporter
MNRQQFWTLIATIIGSGIVFLDSTVVNLALPALSRDLGASFSDLQWIVDGYLLSLSALILIAGSLGDILGRKRIYFFGLIGFGIFSILCGIANSIPMLIAARILQGASAALLVPGGLAIINNTFPAEIRGVAIGRWAAWSGISTIIGPLIGGYFVDSFTWRWIFFINVPLVIVCAYLTHIHIAESRDERSRSIDYLGASLTAAFLALITYGLIEGPAYGWNAVTVLTISIGLLLFALFLWVEYKTVDPMVQLRLFYSRNFSGVNIATFLMYGALAGFFFSLVVFLQTIAHYSSMQAGLSAIPATLILLAFSGRMGTLTDRFGARLFMTVGPILAGCGMLLLLPLSPESVYVASVLPGVILFGIGLTLTVTPLTVTVMRSVKMSDSGIASAINNAISRIAGLIVVALLGLFGVMQAYHFAVLLCGCMAILAGIVSFFFIRDVKT